ncbi:YrzI family small protein [Bacillus spongiae]|uniref:YrzI family small protein n=1 Tax=Bacillus spongiae TaxID=2683610 RepID=A0ABU8H958_9BACI
MTLNIFFITISIRKRQVTAQQLNHELKVKSHFTEVQERNAHYNLF